MFLIVIPNCSGGYDPRYGYPFSLRIDERLGNLYSGGFLPGIPKFLIGLRLTESNLRFRNFGFEKGSPSYEIAAISARIP
jgi:hypothetical protein